MDPLTLIIGVGVTVVIATVMLVIAKFGFGGETEYEQQIARQKEILLDDNKGKGVDKKKVKAEKKKKVKSKADGAAVGQASGSEFEVESGKEEVDGGTVETSGDELSRPHIEYDPDPVVIDEAPPAPSQSKTAKKNKKNAPVKSILHNRDETPLVRSEAGVIAETVYPESAAPKDDLEIKHAKAKKSGKKNKQVNVPVDEPVAVVDEVIAPSKAKVQATAPPPQAQVVEEMVVARSEAPVSAAAPSSPVKRAKGKSAGGRGVSALAGIIEVILQAPLTRDELQTLIESILAKQESEDNWTTKSAKPDPMTLLRKQLEEAQNALTDEHSNVTSAQAKIKELTAKCSAAEKSNAVTVAQIQELQKRMQTSHDQHKAEVQSLTAGGYQDKQMVDQQVEVINQLREENQKLKHSVANGDEVAQMQNDLRTLSTEKQTLTAKIADTEKAATDSKHEQARQQESLKALETEKSTLKKRCDELGQRLAQAETQALEGQSRVAETEKNIMNLQDHIRTQQRDKDSELQTLRDELTKAKHSAPATNGGHSNGRPTNGLSGDVSELENRISQLEQTVSAKDDQVNNLNKQLAVARTSQNELNTLKHKSASDLSQRIEAERNLSELESQIQALKDKNNELRRKNWALNDSLEKAEKSSLSMSATERDVEEKVCTINELKDSNAKLRSLNNELQERGEGMMSLNNEVTSLKKQVNEGKVSLDNKDIIIKQLEESLRTEKQNLSNSKSDAEVQKLKEQICSLNKQVQTSQLDNQKLEDRLNELSNQPQRPVSEDSSNCVSLYKQTLVDVEGMVDSLGVKIEAEHKRMCLALNSKDAELSSVQQKFATALKQLDDSSSHSSQAESARVSDLTSQLEASEKRLADAQKALIEHSSKAKAAAAAIAATGSGDDTGTCV